jgi:DnaJ-class molecular chaperone
LQHKQKKDLAYMLCFDCEDGVVFFFEEGRYHKDICPMCQGTGTIYLDRKPIIVTAPVSAIREKQDSESEDYDWSNPDDILF